MDQHDDVKVWLDAIDSEDARGFVPIKDFDQVPDSIRAESLRWNGEFFGPDTGPYSAGLKVLHSVHAPPPPCFDMLRHVYRVREIDVAVEEALAITLIRLRPVKDTPLGLPEDQRADAIVTLASSILSETAQVSSKKFDFPRRIKEGVLFSSGVRVDPNRMFYWPDRIDGGIRHGAVVFLLYKKSLGTGLPSCIGWFDDAFRAAHSTGS